MKTYNKVMLASVLGGLLVLNGCSSQVTNPEKYSGFLGDYSQLKPVTTPSGKTVMRWIDPSFNKSHYTSLFYQPLTYFPTPKPTDQISQATLNGVLDYANTRLKTAMQRRLPLTNTPVPGSLIFKGAITGVSTSTQGIQFYEVIPVALVIAGTQTATGHRTKNTELFFEGELIDAATGKAVVKVVRMGEGKSVPNSSQQVTVNDLKSVIDNMAVDVTQFNEAAQ
ncbi:DUF3313 domain-containing protein [Rouxiella badensis]|jgi:hypothetical protein|uniref:DUF3313 domain-containing protein n=1 Tax=Rouxiella badensis TaxID=1646377 RepID=UPI003C38078A